MRVFYQVIIRKLNSLFLRKSVFDDLERFGSNYGGWTICTCPNHLPQAGYYLSAGVGEDISFDVELIQNTNLTAILVDPTEKAKKHIERYLSSSDQFEFHSYALNGNQNVEKYYSSKKIRSRIHFINKAFWVDNCGLTLYPPSNSLNVSFSIWKSKNDVSNPILFPSESLDSISLRNGISLEDSRLTFEIIKMDIEGSELFVMQDSKFLTRRPRQIAVEFDFLREPGALRGILRLVRILIKMQSSDYRLAHIENLNYLFLEKNS